MLCGHYYETVINNLLYTYLQSAIYIIYIMLIHFLMNCVLPEKKWVLSDFE